LLLLLLFQRIKNAQMSETPIVVLTGAAPTMLRGRGAVLAMDQKRLVRPICKEIMCVCSVRSIPDVVRNGIILLLE